MSEPVIRKLPRQFVEKVWGVDALPARFDYSGGDRIGEIWFEPPPEMQELLVKFIFTSERLSIQAHPSDAQAREMKLGKAGKSESWIILDAKDGATIAAGVKDATDEDTLRNAALDGTIVDMLDWHEVKRGDCFYIPAGTIHAIGGGIGLVEVQQNNDITFRLYDYGRPRELHLDQGMAVAYAGPYAPEHRRRLSNESGLLVDSPHFTLRSVYCRSGFNHSAGTGAGLLVPVWGNCIIQAEPLSIGECAFVDRIEELRLTGDGLALFTQPKNAPVDL